MLRKPFKAALLPALLVLALGASPGVGAVAGQPGAAGNQSAASATARPPDAVAADIWARTARYIYQANPELAKIPTLPATIRSGSVKAVDRALNEAVKLEGKPLGKSQVFVFKTTVFDKVQAQNPASPQALAAAISTELLKKHPERQSEPEFTRFVSDINQLAEGGGAAAAGDASAALTAAETADNPMAQAAPTENVPGPTKEVPATSAAAPATIIPPQPSGTSLIEWLALAMSGLSLAGVIYLLMSRSSSAPAPVLDVQPATAQPASRSKTPAFTWEEMQRYVQRELEKRPAPAPVAPAPPVAPVNKGARPTAGSTPAARPVSQAAPGKSAPAPQPAPAVVEAAPVPEALPAPVAPPPPPPAPRQRTQYVSEAPFNNVFPARALTDQPSSYSMFAIVSSEQSPDLGIFQVAGNLASHVRDHRTVLEPVCEYVNLPAGNETRIITEQPGQVRRQGQDWVVVAPARIRFEA